MSSARRRAPLRRAASRAASPLVAFCGEFPSNDDEYLQRMDQAAFAASCETGFIRVTSPELADDCVRKAFYRAKLGWFERLARWLAETRTPSEPLVLGGDFNVAPTDIDLWDPAACHGGTHVSAPERRAFGQLCEWGLIDAYRRHGRRVDVEIDEIADTLAAPEPDRASEREIGKALDLLAPGQRSAKPSRLRVFGTMPQESESL